MRLSRAPFAIAMLFVSLSLPLAPEAFAQVAQPIEPAITCDAIVSGLASLAVPGWGQSLNNDSQRKSIIHFTIGLGSTLAMIYRWGTREGNTFRTIRILWGFYSGIEAFSTCYAKRGL